jgi:hypothetical protein
VNFSLLRFGNPVYEQVRIRVSGKQQALKNQHAGRPDRGRTAKPGQDALGHDELNLK